MTLSCESLILVHVGVHLSVLILVQSVPAVLHSCLQSQSVWGLLPAGWFHVSFQRPANAQRQAAYKAYMVYSSTPSKFPKIRHKKQWLCFCFAHAVFRGKYIVYMYSFPFRWSVLRFVTWVTLLVRVSLQVCLFVCYSYVVQYSSWLIVSTARFLTVCSGRKFILPKT